MQNISLSGEIIRGKKGRQKTATKPPMRRRKEIKIAPEILNITAARMARAQMHFQRTNKIIP
jgi:hypothetical protein